MVFPSILVHQPAMYWKMSAESGTSAACATVMGLPLSSDSSSASSPVYFEMRSPIRHTSLPRSDGVMADHGPDSKARRAARTAASMSSLSPSAARAMVAPVAGFFTSKVLPDAAGTHLPSISSFLGASRNCATGRDVWASLITALIVTLLTMTGFHRSASRGAGALETRWVPRGRALTTIGRPPAPRQRALRRGFSGSFQPFPLAQNLARRVVSRDARDAAPGMRRG